MVDRVEEPAERLANAHRLEQVGNPVGVPELRVAGVVLVADPVGGLPVGDADELRGTVEHAERAAVQLRGVGEQVVVIHVEDALGEHRGRGDAGEIGVIGRESAGSDDLVLGDTGVFDDAAAFPDVGHRVAEVLEGLGDLLVDHPRVAGVVDADPVGFDGLLDERVAPLRVAAGHDVGRRRTGVAVAVDGNVGPRVEVFRQVPLDSQHALGVGEAVGPLFLGDELVPDGTVDGCGIDFPRKLVGVAGQLVVECKCHGMRWPT